MSILPASAAGCPYSVFVKGYAACTLTDDQAILIEEHLPVCDTCAQNLVQAVEAGAVPTWLQSLIEQRHVTEDRSTTTGEAQHASQTSELVTPAQRYQKMRVQGAGGMGQVWLGWDSVMQRRVALKQLRSDNRNQERDRRFLQEATALAQLSHPNIVSVHEVLMLDDQPTLVMEFVDGPTLSSSRRDFVMSERQAARLVLDLTDAIAHAHRQGVIHRDLKPGNVLLCWPDGTRRATTDVDCAIPKLTDFGLARTLAGNDLTQTGELLGTPAYMSPEQTLGLTHLAGPGVDIYGLGAILYDLLTGTPPHVGETPVSTMLLVREREPTAPRVLRRELSKDIETICLKCLQKRTQDRYANAEALKADLQAYLDGRPIRARPLGPVRTALSWSRRHRSLVALASLSAVLVMTLLAGSVWTAVQERQLRLDANTARTQAELSEKKFIAEAQRATQALDVNRRHFEVALGRVNRLAHLAYNPRNEDLSTLDFQREIQQATKDIYATYLDSLPPKEQWTLAEAYAVTFYVKYMIALNYRQLAVPWLDRVKSELSRLERDTPNSPLKREFLAQHYTNAHTQAYAEEDLVASGTYGEQLSEFVDVDARHAAFVLMNSALAFSQAGRPSDAIRVANKSVAAYRTAMAQADAKLEDTTTFLEKLRWHRYIARVAGDAQEAEKFVKEFHELAQQFDESSPYYARVQATIKGFN